MMSTELQAEIYQDVIARGRKALVSARPNPDTLWVASTALDAYARKCLTTVGHFNAPKEDPIDHSFNVSGVKLFRAADSPVFGFPTTDDHRQGELMELLGEPEYGALWECIHDSYQGIDEDPTASVILSRGTVVSRAIPAWMVAPGMPLFKRPGCYVVAVTVGEANTCVVVSDSTADNPTTHHVMNNDPVYPLFAPNRVMGVDTASGDKMIAYIQHAG